MSSPKKETNLTSSSLTNQSSTSKKKTDCLLCKIMHLKNEKPAILRWFVTSANHTSKKIRLTKLLTGLDLDQETINCLKDPEAVKFLFPEE